MPTGGAKVVQRAPSVFRVNFIMVISVDNVALIPDAFASPLKREIASSGLGCRCDHLFFLAGNPAKET